MYSRVLKLGEDEFTDCLFQNMFELDPGTQTVFHLHGSYETFKNEPRFARIKASIVRTFGNFIINFDDSYDTKRRLKELGMQHIHRGVERHHFDSFAQAAYVTAHSMLGDSFTDQEQIHMQLFLAGLTEALISDNYAEQQDYLRLYEQTHLSPEETKQAIHVWTKYISPCEEEFGENYFTKLFIICPEIARKISFPDNVTDSSLGVTLNQIGIEILQKCNRFIVSLENPRVLYQLGKLIRNEIGSLDFTPGEVCLVKEALLLYLTEVAGQLSFEVKGAVVKVFKLIRNFIFLKDLDTEIDDPHPTKLSLEKKRIVEQSWKVLKVHRFNEIGPIFFRHMFRLYPQALDFFPFRN